MKRDSNNKNSKMELITIEQIKGKFKVIHILYDINHKEQFIKLKEIVQAEFNEDVKNLVLHFSDEINFDSKYLGFLLGQIKKFKQHNGQLILTGSSDKHFEMFQDMGFMEITEVYHSLDDFFRSNSFLEKATEEIIHKDCGSYYSISLNCPFRESKIFEINDAFQGALALGHKNVLLNLMECERIYNNAIRFINRMKKILKKKNGRLYFLTSGSDINRTIEKYNLNSKGKIYKSIEEIEQEIG